MTIRAETASVCSCKVFIILSFTINTRSSSVLYLLYHLHCDVRVPPSLQQTKSHSESSLSKITVLVLSSQVKSENKPSLIPIGSKEPMTFDLPAHQHFYGINIHLYVRYTSPINKCGNASLLPADDCGNKREESLKSPDNL